MPYQLGTKPAFRCKNCGHLESADHAGEYSHPHLCSCCDAGVLMGFSMKDLFKAHPFLAELTQAELSARTIQNGKVIRLHHLENWEVLADTHPDELAKMGHTPDTVCRHVPFKTKGMEREPINHVRTANDTLNVRENAG